METVGTDGKGAKLKLPAVLASRGATMAVEGEGKSPRIARIYRKVAASHRNRVIAWGVVCAFVVSGFTVFTALQTSEATQRETWQSDLSLLWIYRNDFNNAATNLAFYLQTGSGNAANATADSVANAYLLAERARFELGGFPSGTALNLTASNLCRVSSAVWYLLWPWNGTYSVVGYYNSTPSLEYAQGAFHNLTLLLDTIFRHADPVYGPSANPLVLLGTANATAVRGEVGGLAALYSRFAEIGYC